MKISLQPEFQQFIEQRVKSGGYGTPEDVIQAGLAALQQHEAFGDFGPGELEQLLEEGERSLREEKAIPAEQVFAELRQLSAQRRRQGRRGKAE